MIIPKGLTHNELEKYLRDNYSNLELKSKYRNGSTKVKVTCKIDDNEWEVFPRDIYDNSNNMICEECNRRKSNLILKNKFREHYPTLRIVTMDIFSSPKILIRCDKCKSTFEVYRKHLIGDNIRNFKERVDVSSIVFFKNKKKPFVCETCEINKIKNFFEEVTKERNVTIIGEYVNNTTSVKVKCNICGSEYSVVPIYYVNKITSECKFCKIKKRGKKNV